jgi:chromosome segregation ATPase
MTRRLQSEVDGLKKRCASLEELVEKAEFERGVEEENHADQVASLEAALKGARERIEELESAAARQRDRGAKEREELATAVQEAHSAYQGLIAQHSETERLLKATTEKASLADAALRSGEARWRSESEVFSARIAELEVELEKCKSHDAAETRGLAEELKVTGMAKEALEFSLSNKKIELAELSDEAQQLRRQLASVTESLRETESLLESREALVEELQLQNENLRTGMGSKLEQERCASAQELTELQARIEATDAALAQAKLSGAMEAEALKAELQITQQNLDAARQQLAHAAQIKADGEARLQSAVDTAKETSQALAIQTEALKAQVADLQVALARAESNHREREAALQQENDATLQQLEDIHASAQESIASLQKQLLDSTELIAALRAANDALNVKLSAYSELRSNETTQLQAAAETHQAESQRLRDELLAAQSALRVAQSNASEACARAQNSLALAIRERDELAVALSSKSAELELAAAAAATAAREASSVQEECEALRHKLEGATASLLAEQGVVEHLRMQAESAAVKESAALQRVAALEQERQALLAEREMLLVENKKRTEQQGSELLELRAEASRFAQESAELALQVETLKAEAETLRGAVAAKSAECEALRARADHAGSQATAASLHADALEAQLAEQHALSDEQASALRHNVEAATGLAESLKAELQRRQAAFDELSKAMASVSSDAERLAEAQALAASKILEVEQARDAVLQQLAAVATRLSESEAEKAELEERLRRADKSAEESSVSASDLEEARADVARLREQISDAAKKLDSQRAAWEVEKQALVTTRASLEQQVNEQAAAISAYEARITSLEGAVHAAQLAQQQVSMASKEIAALTRDRESWTAEAAAECRRLEGLLKEATASSEQQKALAGARLTRLTLVESNAAKERAAAASTRSQLESKLASLSDALSSAEQRIEELKLAAAKERAQLAEQLEDLCRLRSQEASAKDQLIARLGAQLDALKCSQAVAAEVEQVRAEFEAQKAELVRSVAELRKELAAKSDAMASAEARMAAVVQEKDDEVANMAAKYATALAGSEKAQKRCSTLESKIKMLETRLARAAVVPGGAPATTAKASAMGALASSAAGPVRSASALAQPLSSKPEGVVDKENCTWRG